MNKFLYSILCQFTQQCGTSFYIIFCSSSLSSVDKFVYSILFQFTQQCEQLSCGLNSILFHTQLSCLFSSQVQFQQCGWTSFYIIFCSSSLSSVDKFVYSILFQFTQQCGQVCLCLFILSCSSSLSSICCSSSLNSVDKFVYSILLFQFTQQCGHVCLFLFQFTQQCGIKILWTSLETLLYLLQFTQQCEQVSLSRSLSSVNKFLYQVSIFYLVPVHSAVWTCLFILACSSSLSSGDKFLYSILFQFTQHIVDKFV